MKKHLEKIILITGATSGIGKATSILFAKKGYNIIITGRRKNKLIDLENQLKKKYAIKVKSLTFDIRDKEKTKKAFNSLSNYWKKIDILLNNAGLAP